MKKLFFLLVFIGLIIYLAHYHSPSALLEHPERVYYGTFDRVFKNISRIIFLLFMLIFFLFSSGTAQQVARSKALIRWWGFSFLAIVLPFTALIVYENPHSIFPWHFFRYGASSMFNPASVREQKLDLYSQLSAPPEVIIFGSSRTFSVSSSYVLQKTGFNAFNMAVSGGGPFDFLAFERLITSSQPENPPLVFMVEILGLGPNIQRWPMPLSAMPYLDLDQQLIIADFTLQDTLSMQAGSDMIYQLAYERLYLRPPAWTFLPDGTGIRDDLAKATYPTALRAFSGTIDQSKTCNRLDSEGMRQLEKMAEFAEENNFSLLFYRSPLNADYLDISDKNNPRYIHCEKIFDAYMTNLVKRNPNVFYRDLTYFEPISQMRWDGFFDAHHLRLNSAELLVDELAGDIHRAAAWSLERRQNPGQQ
ncbi:MAG: hypothetical protein HY867_10170 [Chloroflexi bacterium]|nr:hypothetical protein [Chloroflexota bacterium]